MGQELTEWWKQAACLGMDTNLFFPTNGDYSQVIEVCSDCVVRRHCLEDALSQELDLYGCFGGTTPKQRDQIRMGKLWK